MYTELLAGTSGLALLALDLAVVALLFLLPIGRKYPDDQGDGRALVLLPKPRAVSHARTAAFVVVFVVLDLAHEGFTGAANLDRTYAHAVALLASIAVHAPAELAGYFDGFTLGMRFLVVATILSLAATVSAVPSRRVLIAMQAVWYLTVMLCVDAVLTVLTVLFRLPVAPASLFAQIVALAVGMVAMTRVLFVNFALPRGTVIEFVRRARLSDAALLIATTSAAMAVSAWLAVTILSRASVGFRPVLIALLPLPFAAVCSGLRTALLHVVRIGERHRRPVLSDPPPIDVIVPAYNEESQIADTLRAIDRAAEHYGGHVHVIVGDDASTDRTNELARRTIGVMTAATGEVVNLDHGGKSATLNGALARCTAPIVVRIDADTLVDEWSLHYAIPWFGDPRIGLVQAMLVPRPGRPPFPRMRRFEVLRLYGFTHRALQIVDGVNAVPGVFTAFRRAPAIALGGFTVGMNGEDADFTLGMSRLGYRTWLDEKVIVYEDVPLSYLEFRSQRTRWSRATIHVFARHAPFRAGAAAPKVWFSQTHLLLYKLLAPLRIAGILYIAIFAAFAGTYRFPVLVFLVAFLLLNVITQVVILLLAVRFRMIRHVGWLACWPAFSLLLHVFSLEALLSLPTRPAGLRGTRPDPILAPVVH